MIALLITITAAGFALAIFAVGHLLPAHEAERPGGIR